MNRIRRQGNQPPRRSTKRRSLRLENLEARQLLAAEIDPVPTSHPFISLYDYDGNPMSNWPELVALARDHGHDHDHAHDHHHDHDHDCDHQLDDGHNHHQPLGDDHDHGPDCDCGCQQADDQQLADGVDGHAFVHDHDDDCDHGEDCDCGCRQDDNQQLEDDLDEHKLAHDHDHDHGEDCDCGCRQDDDQGLKDNVDEHEFDDDHDHDCDHGEDCDCGCRQADNQGLGESDEHVLVSNLGGGSSASESRFKWPQPGGLGSSVTITYSYSNLLDGGLSGLLNTDQIRTAVEETFSLWAQYAPLNFVELVDAGPSVTATDNTSYLAAGTPDIRIGHHAFDGPSGTLAHAYYPTSYWGIGGDVHMDSHENWRIGRGPGIDFVEVMVHEVGHALGLGHEETNNAIMNPFYGGRYNGFGTSFLLADDINAVRALYGTGSGSVTPITSNNAPQLEPISDVTMSVVTDTIDVPLIASDVDGDDLSLSAVVVETPADPAIAAASDVTLTLNGSTLTVDPSDQFQGTVVIAATVSDGSLSSTQTFQVLVENGAPIITPIEDQSVSVAVGTLTLPVSATDPEGSTLSMGAQAVVADPIYQEAERLQEQHAFRAASTDGYDYRGHGERYFHDGQSAWFFILPAGGVYRWNGSIASSPQVGQLDSSYHADLNRLYQPGEPETVPADGIVFSWSGSDLTIDMSASALPEFDVIVSASDEFTTSTSSFTVSRANNAPVVAEIPDQRITHNQDSVVVAVAATDADGDDLTYSATASMVDAAGLAAYQLKEQYGLQSAGSDSYNYRGHGERYFHGLGSRWFFMLPNGNVYRWTGNISGSTLVGSVDPSYHSDLNSLFNATEPENGTVSVDLEWSGNQLTIDPAAGFDGSFDVTVEVADQIETVTQTFSVSVSNTAPVIGDIEDVVISYNADSHTITVPASDADGDPLTLSATASQQNSVERTAYDLRIQYDLQSAGRDHYNYRGQGERYFRGLQSQWFYMLPSGAVFQWGGSIASSTQVGQLTPDYHNDLNRLFNAEAPTTANVPVTLSWSGNDLTIDPADGFVGSFNVAVSASDGSQTAETSFAVTITNAAPVITEIADQEISHTLDDLSLTVNATDADGDSLTYTAEAQQIDSLGQRAYELMQQYNFRAARGGDSHNYRGQGERYFNGLGSQWFYILADGGIYRWGGSIAGSTLVGQLDETYHADLNRLFQVEPPSQVPVDVTLSWSDNQLTIDPAEGYTGSFDVVVTVSDGVASDSSEFSVLVADLAPVVEQVEPQSIGPDSSLRIPIIAADPDGEAVTLNAEALHVDEIAQRAYDLMQAHQFRAASVEAYNYRGHNEKYFYGDGSQWYYILEQGDIYRWGGSIAASTWAAQLDSSYHADLTKLYSAQNVQPITAPVSIVWDSNDLVLTPQTGFSGSFNVRVDATSATGTTSMTFAVTVQESDVIVAELIENDLVDLLASGARTSPLLASSLQDIALSAIVEEL